MNKYYFIVPLVLLGGFIFLYRGAVAEMDLKEKNHQAAVAAAKAEEEAKRKDAEAKAQADAEKHQKEREEEEKAKLAKKEKDYNDAMAKLKHESDGYAADVDKLTKESAELEIALLNGRILRDKTSREAFELYKQVELVKINRRTAELEIQRLIEMVGAKASASSLASMPPPPPAARK